MVEPTICGLNAFGHEDYAIEFRARAAWAATAVARFPVEAQETVVKPNSRALLIRDRDHAGPYMRESDG